NWSDTYSSPRRHRPDNRSTRPRPAPSPPPSAPPPVEFPPCASILIRAAQTRRQRPQPSHPRGQGAGKRRFVIAESAEGLRVVGEAPAASPRWPLSAPHPL